MATTTQLAQAEAALHQYLTGSKAVSVKKADGSTVMFNASNVGDLRAYIAELKHALGQTPVSRRYAIGVGFNG